MIFAKQTSENILYSDTKTKIPEQGEHYVDSLPLRSTLVESAPLPFDNFYPDVTGFIAHDFKDLEKYLDSHSNLCMNSYSRGVIERARD